MPTRPLDPNAPPLPGIFPPEDFWGRRHHAQRFSFDFAPLGAPTEITANDPAALVAAQLSARRFSRIVEPGGQAMHIQIVARAAPMTPLPDDLTSRLHYSGVGDWITLSAGEWGQAFGNLQTRHAVIVAGPALAADTRLLSRYFIDHYLLNFLFTEWAMLHASCVLDPSGLRLIILVGPHNSGKSTTALHLARAGYFFLADGMVLLKLKSSRFIVGGYPIGEVKLRDDVLGQFSEYAGQQVQVREQSKTVVDLRAAHPNRVAESLIVPNAVQLVYVERGPLTHATPLRMHEAQDLITPNTVYWNEPDSLEHNTAALHYLLRVSTLYRLSLGPNPEDTRDVLESLP